MMQPFKNHYLADGLYCDWDGYQLRLWCEREYGVHEVFLDDHTLAAFLRLVEGMDHKKESERQ